MSRKNITNQAARPVGRPTKFKPEFVKLGFKLALLGATDDAMAEAFDVATSTLALWKRTEPAFSDALKRGKADADADVVRALYRRATGFRRRTEKIFCTKGGEIVRAEAIEYFPPDVTACIYWLKNRQPEKWREANRAGDEAGGFKVNVYIDADTDALCRTNESNSVQ